MKLNLLIITFSVLTLISCTSKEYKLLGKWRITEIREKGLCDKCPPMSVTNPETVIDRKYDSHVKPVNGTLFYLSKIKDATIEFEKDSVLKTTLFYSNFGKKKYEYYPKLDTLKIKFIDPDSLITSTGEQIIYQGQTNFINSKKIEWVLSKYESLILEKERT